MIVKTVRALKDNYCYLLVPRGSSTAAVVDPSEASPVFKALDELNLKLGLILNTHHHHDHVGGNLELREKWNCDVVCSERDFERVPGATKSVRDGDQFDFENLKVRVLEIPGHTEGQIAFHVDDALFVGDTLFEMGCGRLFEGSMEQMFSSLAKIKALPPATKLFFGHEYTETNARFALEVEPHNSQAIDERLREVRVELSNEGHALAPTLARELEVNPFLRAKDVAQFKNFRERRNVFT